LANRKINSTRAGGKWSRTLILLLRNKQLANNIFLMCKNVLAVLCLGLMLPSIYYYFALPVRCGSCIEVRMRRYMYAGAAHADSSDYQPCIALWNYALQLKIHKECTQTNMALIDKEVC
jgi:hypothetical protein